MDFGSNDIYISSPFSHFVSVHVYTPVCDFVCITLLLPFVLGFSLFVFFFFYLKKFFFLIIIFYFNNFILFYFILSSFFLFFSPFYSESCGGQAPGAPARRQGCATEVGEPSSGHCPQETSQLHVISNGENLPEISISMPRPSSTQRPASYSAGHRMQNN